MIKIAIDLLYSAPCSQLIMHFNVIIPSSNTSLLTNNNNNIIVKDEWLHTNTPTITHIVINVLFLTNVTESLNYLPSIFKL